MIAPVPEVLPLTHVRNVARPRVETLSEPMRDALTQARHAGPTGLRRVHSPGPGAPPWPAHPATLAALVRADLLTRQELRNRKGWKVDAWVITDLGRAAFEPVETIQLQRPAFLARAGRVRYRKLPNNRWTVDTSSSSGDYTTDASRSIDNDLAPNARGATAVEVIVGPDELDVFARKARDREREVLQHEGDRLDAATIDYRIGLLKQHAADTGTNLSSDLRLIEHLVDVGRRPAAKAKLYELEVRLNRRAA